MCVWHGCGLWACSEVGWSMLPREGGLLPVPLGSGLHRANGVCQLSDLQAAMSPGNLSEALTSSVASCLQAGQSSCPLQGGSVQSA